MNETWWVQPQQLDTNQRKIISLPRRGSYLIVGPPGSGKTNLLILRANYLIRANRSNILMLVFTRTLEEFIASCPTPYSVPRDQLKTSQRWQMGLIRQLGGRPIISEDFEESRRQNCATLAKLIEAKRIHKMYQTILLDEAQDYRPEEIDLFFALAEDVFAAADSHQQIYDHDDPIPALAQRANKMELIYHYRNGHNICRVADSIGITWSGYAPLHASSQYDEKGRPSTVEHRQCNSREEQVQEIAKALRVQVKAYPKELIGVLCPLRKDLATIQSILSATDDLAPLIVYQGVDDSFISFDNDKRIIVCTLHSAKGVEFRASHIMNLEGIRKFRTQRKLAYTGVTRTKTALTAYDCGRPPAFLASALSIVGPSTGPPRIDDLFREA